MNNQEQITGEWISEQINIVKSAFQKYKTENNNNRFIYNPNSRILNDRVTYLQSICPHEYDKENKKCIYCGKVQK